MVATCLLILLAITGAAVLFQSARRYGTPRNSPQPEVHPGDRTRGASVTASDSSTRAASADGSADAAASAPATATPTPEEPDTTARPHADDEPAALQAIVSLAEPSQERLNRIRHFLTTFPASAHRGAIVRECVHDMGQLLHGVGSDTDMAVLNAYREALVAVQDELADLASKDSAFWTRLSSVLQATTSALVAASAPTLTPTDAWQDAAVTLGLQLVGQRATDDREACELCVTLFDAVPAHPRRKELVMQLIARVQAVLATPWRGTQSVSDTLLDRTNTAANELLKADESGTSQDACIYEAACFLAARGQAATALTLTERLLRRSPDSPRAEEIRRQRRLWSPEIAARDRQTLAQRAAERIEQELPDALQLDERAVAEELGIDWPVGPPTMSETEIAQAVSQRVTREVSSRFPVSALEDIKRRAADTYKAYEIGETVSLRLKIGQKRHGSVTGRVMKVYPNHIRIGDRYVPKVDLLDDDLIRLDPALCEQMREAYVRQHSEALNEQRKEFEKEAIKALTNILYARAGYIALDGRWETQESVLRDALAQRRKVLADALKERIEREVFQRAGFVRRNGQWEPARKG